MSTLLIGCWSQDRATLTLTASHRVDNGDQATIDALTQSAFTDGSNWACAFDVDTHSHAVQRAYEEFARDDDAAIEDDVEGFTPETR
ncbi:hypothetical protein [Streptomyces sp. NPDC059611]|uniref:hypothetical protein n=1 Tax=Streptomyces sp. NPDC059611 TaxID=3346884 RepID=UPI0036CF1240